MEPVLMGNEILTIDADTRTIEVPSDFLLGVETDNDAERVEFQCPKIVGDNLDLSQYHIYIHYQNAKGEKGKYLCEDIEDGGENITFSWLLSQKVTLYKGQTKFLVCAKKTQEETIVWNTTLASGNVLEGLDVDEDIVQQNDDVIEQILLKLEQIESSGGTTDYNGLTNKPSINGIELSGNKTSSDLKMYTQEEVNYLLDDKMDKPYYDISITDDVTIENTLAGNFKIDSIEGSVYQAEESGIVPTPERPIPIRSKKITVDGEVVELRSLKEGSKNVFDLNILLMQEETDYELNPAYKNIKTLILNLKPNTTYIASTNATGDISATDVENNRCFYFTNVNDSILLSTSCAVINGVTRQKTSDKNGHLRVVIFSRRQNAQQFINGEAWVQIEEGSSATSYVPPTVRDYKIVDHTTKTSKIVRNVGFQNLNELNWAYGSRGLDHIRLYVLPSQALRYVAQKSYCNVLESFYTAFDYSKQGIYCGNTSGSKTLSVMINQDILGNNPDKFDELFKAYINNPDAAVLYPLETPTEESIPYLEDDASEVGLSWQDSTSPSPDIKSEIYEVDEINIKTVGKNIFNPDSTDTASNPVYSVIIVNPLNAQITVSITDNDTSVDITGINLGVSGNAEYFDSLFWMIASSANVRTKTTNSKCIVYYPKTKETLQKLTQRFNIQIEYGSVATPYTPYQETSIQHTLSKPLRAIKDGSIKDIIDIVNMQITYNMTDFIVDGNTTIELDTDKEKTRVIKINNHPFRNHTDNLKMCCDKLVNGSGKDEELFIVTTSLYISINKNRVAENDISEFKKWLGENPLYFIGISNNPTTEPLEDELVQKLKTLKTFSPVTHVFIEGVVKPTLNAQYPKDIAVAQAQLEQKVLLISETLKTTQANLLLQGGND